MAGRPLLAPLIQVEANVQQEAQNETAWKRTHLMDYKGHTSQALGRP